MSYIRAIHEDLSLGDLLLIHELMDIREDLEYEARKEAERK